MPVVARLRDKPRPAAKR